MIKHFINLKDIPALDLRKIILDAKKRKLKRNQQIKKQHKRKRLLKNLPQRSQPQRKRL